MLYVSREPLRYYFQIGVQSSSSSLRVNRWGTSFLLPNIKYIFSVSKIDGECTDKKVLDYFDKTFTAVSTKDNANCHGACIDCMLCYTDNDVKVIRERKK